MQKSSWIIPNKKEGVFATTEGKNDKQQPTRAGTGTLPKRNGFPKKEIYFQWGAGGQVNVVLRWRAPKCSYMRGERIEKQKKKKKIKKTKKKLKKKQKKEKKTKKKKKKKE